MITINLETSAGIRVAEAEILPFRELPAVVTWGTRVFSLHDKGSVLEVRPPVYREVFAAPVVSTLERPEPRT